MQVLLTDFADAGNAANLERREEASLVWREDPEHAIGLGLVRGNLGNQAGAGDADGTVQAGGFLDGPVQHVSSAEGRPVEALGAGHIEVGFVDGNHLDLWREVLQNGKN